MSLSYGSEKLFLAVEGLASSTEPVQKRLANAVIYHIIHVHEENVPRETWERLKKLNEAVTARKAVAGEGSVVASTSAMGEDEAVKWIREIVSMFSEVARARGE